METIIIQDTEAGERLDKILAERFKNVYSRTYFQYLIESNLVLLNGQPVKKRIKPENGDEVEINFALTPEVDLRPEPIPLNIVFEDESIILINKPPGLVVHPAPGNWTGTLVNGLVFHCKELNDGSSLRPGIVHRLDKDTSGLLLAAKTTQVQAKLIEMFANREIDKEYLAICIGNPGKKEIHAPIGRHPIHRQKMAVLEAGKHASTVCDTIKTNGQISLVHVQLLTGRTHQIRVHMKHVGTPVLGDETYGNTQVNSRYGVGRQMLHASGLKFKHPMTGQIMEFKAPMPEDMQKVAGSIR